MASGRGGGRLGSRIRDAASAATDSAEFRALVLDAIHARVPFDGACLGTTDPATIVPTQVTTIGYDDPRALPAAIEFEYRAQHEASRFDAMLGWATPIRTLRQATPGPLRSSRHYAELLAPFGMRDEVRMVFRGRDALCWGVCIITRGSGSDFQDDEVRALAGALPEIGDGMRSTLFRETVRDVPAEPDGPAVAIIGAGNEFESVSPAAMDYFERLCWGSPDRPAWTAPALAAAVRLRSSNVDSAAFRARTLDGAWVMIRVGRLRDARSPGCVVVTVERAQFPHIVSLLAAAYGLTAREMDVVTQLLAGWTREEIGQRLFISPYTVQDHLKSIYAKTGVNSRAHLVARLAHTQYVPRLGSPVGADGWFSQPSERQQLTR